jgi:aminopeptidase YwaD
MSNKILVFFLFFGFQVFSQIDIKQAKEMTQKLSSKDFFGRGYVNSGDSLAAIYLASEFEKRSKSSKNLVYVQPFSFDVNSFPDKMDLFFDEEKLIPGIDFIVDPNSGGFYGDWKYKFLSLESCLNSTFMEEIIFKNSSNSKEYNSFLVDTRNLKGDSLRTIMTNLTLLSDFTNVLIFTDDKFTFSVGRRKSNFVMIHCRMEKFNPKTRISSAIDAKFIKNHTAYNVFYTIPAKKKQKKHIVFTAHYDHLGGMGNHVYFPGANDNASGTSMLFSLADHYLKKPSKYNISLIGFAGEEAGLLGSKYFTENPLIPLKNIKFLLNLDIMGSGEEGITVVNGTIHKKEFDLLCSINQKKEYLPIIKSRGKAANSDHYWFSEKGVPSFFIYTMGPNKNYHDIFDTFEELSFNKYENIVRLLIEFVAKLK